MTTTARQRVRRTAATASATVLLATLLSVTTGTPAGAGSVCTPAWSLMPASAIAPDRDTEVVGVNVLSATDVRFTENHSNAGTQTLTWNGRKLTENGPQIPQPPWTRSSFQADRGSFDSAKSGWVKTSLLPGYSPSTLARWDGSRWTLVPGAVSPTPEKGAATVHGIASLAPNLAWAVGDTSDGGALIERWDGTEWTVVGHPAADRPRDTLIAVRALSATDIWASGTHRDPDTGRYQPMILHYDGTTWTETALPGIESGGSLQSIAATGPDDIWAGGWKGTETQPEPLLLHWDGQSWTEAPAPANTPGGSQFHRLYAPAPGDLWAITLGADPSFRVMHWTGGSWQRVKPQGAVPDTYEFYFHDIAGTGPNDVWVVGASTFTEPSDFGYPRVRTRRLIAHLSCGGK
ncbi:hypothetical protein OHA77_03660 [Streptosporangium sp. NBC_01639]|uniref:WD40/YVTN/BNR-like repeat-containing protein n=1 Tax=Streptosporangium sp. NBC_01639 TaxID=2975948 RepID=UPI0038637CEC|nr:hypothetical protein OHA77_03660 [Streptosporangium sp. NBC_01639]